VALDVGQKEGLKEQIAQDKAQIDRMYLAITRLEDHIAYCEKKLG
jgi:hypothetical protein